MEIFIKIGQLLLCLSILVIVHEFGHFITARMFGIKVEKFFLFFDAWNIKLFKIKYKETEYGIGWLPLGGYVKIAGMIDESMDKEQMKKPPQPWEFRSKPAWQKFIVMIGGVVLNLILGVLIFTFWLKGYQKEYLPIEEVNKYGIYAFEPAVEYGFQSGDKILKIDNKPVKRFKDILSTRSLFGATYQIERNGELIEITTPDTLYKDYKNNREKYLYFILNYNHPFHVDSLGDDGPGKKAGLMAGDSIIAIDSVKITSYGKFFETIKKRANKEIQLTIKRNYVKDTFSLHLDSNAKIGFYASQPQYNYTSYNLNSALKYGTHDAIDVIVSNIKGFGKIIKGEEKAKESVSGILGLLQFFGSKWDWANFWFLTGMLSLVLAFMNILPIPALDGGHVMIILIESIIGRKLPDKVLEVIQIIGLIIIIALMVFIFGIDISNLINKP